MMDVTQRKLEVWQIATRPDPDLYAVVAIVATIPDTASAVVRFANSSYVGAIYPVGSVLDAVVRIGCRQVAAIAMASLNRDLVDGWGAPELWEESLAVGRAAKVIGRIMGFSHREAEQLFVAGLFSCSGAAALLQADAGYLAWRSRQWSRGITDDQLLHRERMAFEMDHVNAAARLLDEWNLPTAIIEMVSFHHAPRSRSDLALWAGMTVLDAGSVARCHDTPFAAALEELGLAGHIDSVHAEALRYVDALRLDTPVESQKPMPALVTR
jgi:HD-like signal output (HDOD) protein